MAIRILKGVTPQSIKIYFRLNFDITQTGVDFFIVLFRRNLIHYRNWPAMHTASEAHYLHLFGKKIFDKRSVLIR